MPVCVFDVDRGCIAVPGKKSSDVSCRGHSERGTRNEFVEWGEVQNDPDLVGVLFGDTEEACSKSYSLCWGDDIGLQKILHKLPDGRGVLHGHLRELGGAFDPRPSQAVLDYGL